MAENISRAEKAFLIFCDIGDTKMIRDWHELSPQEQADWRVAYPGTERSDDLPLRPTVWPGPHPPATVLLRDIDGQSLQSTPQLQSSLATQVLSIAPIPYPNNLPNLASTQNPVNNIRQTIPQGLSNRAIADSMDEWVATATDYNVENRGMCPACASQKHGKNVCRGPAPCERCLRVGFSALVCRNIPGGAYTTKIRTKLSNRRKRMGEKSRKPDIKPFKKDDFGDGSGGGSGRGGIAV